MNDINFRSIQLQVSKMGNIRDNLHNIAENVNILNEILNLTYLSERCFSQCQFKNNRNNCRNKHYKIRKYFNSTIKCEIIVKYYVSATYINAR